MRYINLSSLLALRIISTKVKNRFPTYQSMIEQKFLLPEEVSLYNEIALTQSK